MPYALDYSAGHPTAAQVTAAGYVGVIRYVGFDPAQRPKCMTAAEYADMTGHGVPVALVYENTAGDMLAGRAAGQTAAQRARAWAGRIGFPAHRPIYYACDTDIIFGAARWDALQAAGAIGLVEHLHGAPLTASQMGAVLDYLRGAADVEGDVGLVGVYGEYDVMEQAALAGVARFFWQTRAWSGGRRSPHADLLQEIGTYVVGGIACDRNTILTPDWGQTGATPIPPEDAMPTPDELWDVQIKWPTGVTDVPHAQPSYTAREWLIGANLNGARALREANDAQAAVARLALQVGAQANDEQVILAAITASAGTLEAKLIAAIEAAPQAPGGGVDAKAVVAELRDALARGEQ